MPPSTELQLPHTLTTARTKRGLSQQQCAERIGMDASRLCALEKGRQKSPNQAVIDRIASGLELSEREKIALRNAASHDRLIHHAQDEFNPATVKLLANALTAAQMLSESELLDLNDYIFGSVTAKRALTHIKDRNTTP